jgi:hypothetical protein
VIGATPRSAKENQMKYVLSLAIGAACLVTPPVFAQSGVPSQCAYAEHIGNQVWRFVNKCDFSVQWVVTCQVHNRFCGTFFEVFVTPGETKQGRIADPGVEIGGPHFVN